MSLRILLSGGGTAGHINPAVAISKYAIEKDKDTKILFVGTKKGLESTLVPKEGFDIKYVNVDGLKKKLSVESIISLTKLAFAVAKAVNILREFKPDVVVGTGGYVCVSSVIAAKLLKIPTLVHEQNVFPGAAVKFLSDKADVIASSFYESKEYLKNAKRLELTGNPIRPAILSHVMGAAKEELGVAGKKVILSFGGSLGANKINDVIVDLIEKYPPKDDTVIFFGTGTRDYDRVMEKIKDRKINLPSNIKILPYIDNMDVLMNAADVVISRSGAITLAEICALGKPSILIPSPNVTNNHQEYNARALSDRGAAITITEKEFSADVLYSSLSKILEDEEYRKNMEAKSKKMGITDATEKIYKILLELTK